VTATAPPVTLADERRAAVWAAAYHFLLLFGYYTIRPLRDAMGLRGNVKTLPWLFAGTLGAMMLATPLFAALVERLPRGRFVPLVYHFFAANLIVFFLALRSPSIVAARIFFVWTSVFNLFAVSVFWGFMADRFDPVAGARRFGLIAFGGTLGATAGAALTSLLAERIGPANLTLVAALLLEAAVLCFFQVARGQLPPKSAAADVPRRPVWTFAAALARSPYLLALAAYMLLYTITSTFAYLEQARLAQAAVQGDAARTALFARMDLAVNVASLVLQATLTALLLRRAGVTATLTLLPLLTLAGFAALAVHPSFALIVIFQIARRTTDYFAARPAREMCFIVVGREEKYAAKSFIDTFIYRGGDALGASAFGLFSAVAPIVAVPLCAVWVGVALFLGRRQARLSRPS
jgi:ATP:ADP antiporter, AAA family